MATNYPIPSDLAAGVVLVHKDGRRACGQVIRITDSSWFIRWESEPGVTLEHSFCFKVGKPRGHSAYKGEKYDWVIEYDGRETIPYPDARGTINQIKPTLWVPSATPETTPVDEALLRQLSDLQKEPPINVSLQTDPLLYDPATTTISFLSVWRGRDDRHTYHRDCAVSPPDEHGIRNVTIHPAHRYPELMDQPIVLQWRAAQMTDKSRGWTEPLPVPLCWYETELAAQIHQHLQSPTRLMWECKKCAEKLEEHADHPIRVLSNRMCSVALGPLQFDRIEEKLITPDQARRRSIRHKYFDAETWASMVSKMSTESIVANINSHLATLHRMVALQVKESKRKHPRPAVLMAIECQLETFRQAEDNLLFLLQTYTDADLQDVLVEVDDDAIEQAINDLKSGRDRMVSMSTVAGIEAWLKAAQDQGPPLQEPAPTPEPVPKPEIQVHGHLAPGPTAPETIDALNQLVQLVVASALSGKPTGIDPETAPYILILCNRPEGAAEIDPDWITVYCDKGHGPDAIGEIKRWTVTGHHTLQSSDQDIPHYVLEAAESITEPLRHHTVPWREYTPPTETMEPQHDDALAQEMMALAQTAMDAFAGDPVAAEKLEKLSQDPDERSSIITCPWCAWPKASLRAGVLGPHYDFSNSPCPMEGWQLMEAQEVVEGRTKVLEKPFDKLGCPACNRFVKLDRLLTDIGVSRAMGFADHRTNDRKICKLGSRKTVRGVLQAIEDERLEWKATEDRLALSPAEYLEALRQNSLKSMRWYDQLQTDIHYLPDSTLAEYDPPTWAADRLELIEQAPENGLTMSFCLHCSKPVLRLKGQASYLTKSHDHNMKPCPCAGMSLEQMLVWARKDSADEEPEPLPEPVPVEEVEGAIVSGPDRETQQDLGQVQGEEPGLRVSELQVDQAASASTEDITLKCHSIYQQNGDRCELPQGHDGTHLGPRHPWSNPRFPDATSQHTWVDEHQRDETDPQPKVICLISCCGPKLEFRAPASELYDSPLFRMARAWAEIFTGEWAILSAKHGLVLPDQELDPYDEEIPDTVASRIEWQRMLTAQVKERWPDELAVHFVVLAGAKYSGWLSLTSYPYSLPLQGMEIGERLQALKRALAGEKALNLPTGIEALLKRPEPLPLTIVRTIEQEPPEGWRHCKGCGRPRPLEHPFIDSFGRFLSHRTITAEGSISCEGDPGAGHIPAPLKHQPAAPPSEAPAPAPTLSPKPKARAKIVMGDTTQLSLFGDSR